MDDFLTYTPVFWQWWILASILLSFEVALPVLFFLWLGIAAGVMGVVVLIMPDIPFSLQLIIYGVLSIISVAISRMLIAKGLKNPHAHTVNQGARSYLNTTITLKNPIVDGQGKEKVGSTSWLIKGPDLPVGTKVTLVAIDGTTFVVEPKDPPSSSL